MNEDAWNDDDDGDDDEETTIPCPHCGHSIYEDSERCPNCGNYITEDDAASGHKPWWIVVGALLVFYVIYRWTAG